jgi:alcohol dehydrogenase class IV
MSPLINFTFRPFPIQIIFGHRSIFQLKKIIADTRASKVVAVLDSFFKNSQIVNSITELTYEANAGLQCFFVPSREPDTASVENCRNYLLDQKPDIVIAMGGGSTMDTAKVARISLKSQEPIDNLDGFDRDLGQPDSILICIPTTAGTASEVSEMAIISKHGSDLKLRYRTKGMLANIALLDPELTLSMPPFVTAITGFDALTHAIESYVSRLASPITDSLALDSIDRLVNWLSVAFNEPENLRARSECLLASMLSGIAFNTAQLGLCHAISAPLGNNYNIPHGLANALVLSEVLAFNAPALGEKKVQLRRVFATEDLAGRICDLRRCLKLTEGLDRYLTSQNERQSVAEAAMKSGNIQTNPREVNLTDVLGVLEASRKHLK